MFTVVAGSLPSVTALASVTFTDGIASSSVMVMVAPVMVRPPAVPSTVRVSSSSSRVSLVGVRAKVFVPLRAAASIVRVTSATAA